MHAMSSGQGEPLMLVPGFGASMEVWALNREVLGQHYQVLCMDLPGCGQSTKVALERLEDFTNWLVRLLDHFALPAAHMVGSSFGGMFSAGFALHHPTRVHSLILVGSAGLGPDTAEAFRKRVIAAQTRAEVRSIQEELMHDPAKISDAAVERMIAYKNEPGVPEVLNQLNAARSEWDRFVAEHIEEIRVPLLVVWGKNDQQYPVAYAKRLRHLPNAQLFLLDDCGHLPQVEAAEKFNARLLDFLREAETAS